MSDYTAKERLDWHLQQTPKDKLWSRINFVMTKALEIEEGRNLSEFEQAQLSREKKLIGEEPRFWAECCPPWVN